MSLSIAMTYLALELRAQWGRFALAVLSVALGVGLALAIHLVNQSALNEFAKALALVNGQAQAQLLPTRAGALDESVFEALINEPALASLHRDASPVIDVQVAIDGLAEPVRLIGIDPFRAAVVTPALLPMPAKALDAGGAASLLFADDAVFFSDALARKLSLTPITGGLAEPSTKPSTEPSTEPPTGLPSELPKQPASEPPRQRPIEPGDRVLISNQAARHALTFAGSLPAAAADQQLAVMDIASLQWRLGWLGKLSRIDLVWHDQGAANRAQALLRERFGDSVKLVRPDLAGQQISNLSRAYRVNLTVLSLVATLTGGFMVWTSLSAAIARQTRSLALLGMLGLSRQSLNRLVITVGFALGLAGAALGVVTGVALARALLNWIGADLGAGYFSGSRFPLDLTVGSIVPFALLGIATAVAGAWGPARRVGRLSFAQSLRGVQAPELAGGHRVALLLFALGAALLTLPSIAGLPLAAYAAIALWLIAGIQCTAALLHGASRLLNRAEAKLVGAPALWLAAQRSLGDRVSAKQAARAAAAVVASFALACAMATMVYSFRGSVADWLTQVLPADLYGRAGQQAGVGLLNLRQQQLIREIPGVERAEFIRSLSITLDAARADVSLLARPMPRATAKPHGISAEAVAKQLPITGPIIAPPPGLVPIYVSEPVVSLHQLRPGDRVKLPALSRDSDFFVSAVWRDYARQQGAIVIALEDYQRLSADFSVNEVALWKQDGAAIEAILSDARAPSRAELGHLQWRSAGDLRQLSLKIFDRSFALTYVLEAIAIAVALLGVTASFGAQALARLREFAVSRYLGFSKTDVLRQLSAESLLVLLIAVVWGLLLGLAIAAVLVFRVNPQSFHWTMELRLPWTELAVAAALLVALGSLAAVATAQRMMAPRLRQSLQDDW